MDLSNNQLERAENGDLTALAKLDQCGFIMSSDETSRQYVQRIRTFRENSLKMESALRQKGEYEFEGMTFKETQRIPEKIFREASEVCEKKYAFSIDWVPGFYMNPRFSMLFGGCAFSYYPDFFALFIIRQSFKKKKKWLIYNRDELLSHELCHIARIALNSTKYEEIFAYQTSTSFFRRLMGGIFLSQTDSFLFLGSVFLFLIGQILRTFWLPSMPFFIFGCLPIISVSWLGIRYARILSKFKTARMKLEKRFCGKALAVLFRCTDAEIDEIASTNDVNAYIDSKNSLNWKMMRESYK